MIKTQFCQVNTVKEFLSRRKDGYGIPYIQCSDELNAELYEITGVDSGIAVALKFIDQGEGATTTLYYVMINPNADLSDVEEYVRDPIDPNNPGDEDEMVNE